MTESTQAYKYVVVSTANWQDKPYIHGIYDNLTTANNAAKAIIVKELGCFVAVQYDQNGCLFMGKQKESGNTKITSKRKRADTNEDGFRIHVLMDQPRDSTTFTKNITLYMFEQRYEQQNPDDEDENDEASTEYTEDKRYFLTMPAALKHWNQVTAGCEEGLRQLLDEGVLPDYTEDDIDSCTTRVYSLDEHHVTAIFPRNGKQVKKGYVQIRTEVGKPKFYRVSDWDGSEEGYNKLLPSAPLRPNALKAVAAEETSKRVKLAPSEEEQE